MKIGAQLYTVRDFCKTTEEFSNTLAKIADIGYRYVQVSGTCAYEADWLRRELNKNGLACVLTHIPADALIHQTEKAIADHEVFGCPYIGLGFYDFGVPPERYSLFGQTFLPVAEKIMQSGKMFMYHNHDGEFQKIEGKTVFQKLSEDVAPSLMGFTLDTYWVQRGGGDSADWLKRLSGRVDCIHLKDYAYGGQMAVVGEGNLNFERIFLEAEKSGTKYMLVEQDDCNGEDPFECLRRSYNTLRSYGFE